MGICRHVNVFISKEIVSPMTMGFLNPCIFLPAGEIDKETLRLILVHELTHIHHKDFFNEADDACDFKSLLVLSGS